MKTKIDSSFNYKKAIQALNLFALKEGGIINRMKVLKLIFLADRYHLRKYGRLITGDNYFAMRKGPVASQTKDIIEKRTYRTHENDYSNSYLAPNGTREIKSIACPDDKVFSKSDIEAIEYIWDKFGSYDQFELADNITHKYPEWKRHEHELDSKKRVPMDLNDFFDDPKADVDKCYELSDEDKGIRRNHFEEMAYVQSLWR